MAAEIGVTPKELIVAQDPWPVPIVLVLEHRSTCTLASCVATVPPAAAKRRTDKLQIHAAQHDH